MADLKIGVVGIPGKWSTETLADQVAARTGERLVIDMSRVELDLAKGHLWYQAHDLCRFDGLVVKKISADYSPNTLDRLELLRVAEAAGVRVFSRVKSMLRLVDRLACTVTLRNAGIPLPETRVTESLAAARLAVEEFGSAICKPLYSSKARGMLVIEAGQPADAIDLALRRFQEENPMLYIQRKLSLPGQDLGLVFLDGEYLGCYARVAESSAWNTTIDSGGRYAAHAPDKEVIALAQRAQALFGMDFTTVDVAQSERGAVVFEVSAFGGFRGALEGAGIDAAALYADHVLKQFGKR